MTFIRGRFTNKPVAYSGALFTLFQNDGKVHVWHLPKEKYDVNCLVPIVKHGGGGVMMWGCFSWQGMGPLVRIDG